MNAKRLGNELRNFPLRIILIVRLAASLADIMKGMGNLFLSVRRDFIKPGFMIWIVNFLGSKSVLKHSAK